MGTKKTPFPWCLFGPQNFWGPKKHHGVVFFWSPQGVILVPRWCFVGPQNKQMVFFWSPKSVFLVPKKLGSTITPYWQIVFFNKKCFFGPQMVLFWFPNGFFLVPQNITLVPKGVFLVPKSANGVILVPKRCFFGPQWRKYAAGGVWGKGERSG